MKKFKFHLVPKQGRWIFALAMILFGTGANAQGTADGSTLLLAMIVLGLVAVVVLLVAVYALQVLNKVVRMEEERQAKTKGIVIVPAESLWQKFLKIANKRVEMEKEEAIILDHNYDGIRELDNHLPPWWTYLFYATVVFGIVYVMAYHFTDSLPLQEEEYEIEMAEAAALAQARMVNSPSETFNEADLALTDDPIIVAGGAKLFKQQCAICHKEDASGNIGPNLTDDNWLYGGDVKSIYNIIKEGSPDASKGMISWKGMFSPAQMRDLTMYIKSLKGTNPVGAKKPEGELYEGE